MTETLAHALTWRQKQQGLWVATAADARPVGIITEKWVHGFVVTGRTGRDLGTYRSLEEAQATLAASL